MEEIWHAVNIWAFQAHCIDLKLIENQISSRVTDLYEMLQSCLNQYGMERSSIRLSDPFSSGFS